MAQAGDDNTLEGIEKMLARTTKLEFLILSVGLLVLVFCSQPPQYGSAEVGHSQPVKLGSSWPPDDMAPMGNGNDLPASSSPSTENIERMALDAGSVPADSLGPPRMGTVDARNIRQSPYNDVMYGNVTVRWVWDGQRFVPQKVCVIEEKNGVSSVWSFDQQGDAVVSEIPAGPAASH